MGHLGGSAIKPLPSAQVMISASWDQALHPSPCSVERLLLPLPLPATLPTCPLSISLSNK